MNPDLISRFALFFDWDCAARKLLSDEQKRLYVHLMRERRKQYDEDKKLLKYQLAASVAWAVAYDTV